MQHLAAYFLVGPTAVGKTALAQRIAEEEDFDILSADSMLVYRGMDIGTSKPSLSERGGVRYFGIDLVDPDQIFSVWEYRRHALKAIEDSGRDGRRLMVVGGTGLYVKSLTTGLRAAPGADPHLRQAWAEVVAAQGLEPLQAALREKAPSLYDALPDKRNARRLIRALETADSVSPPETPSGHAAKEDVPVVALTLPMPALKTRIASRVEQMYRDGLVEETELLVKRFGALSRTAGQAIGYAEALDVVQGRCSPGEAAAKTVSRTVRLARRQMTWFRHQSRVTWIAADSEADGACAALKALAHWREYGPTAIAR